MMKNQGEIYVKRHRVKVGGDRLPATTPHRQIQMVYRVGGQFQLLRGAGGRTDLGQPGQILGLATGSATPVGEATALCRQVMEEVHRWG